MLEFKKTNEISKRKLSEDQSNKVLEYVNNMERYDLEATVFSLEIEYLESLDEKTFNETWDEYYK